MQGSGLSRPSREVVFDAGWLCILLHVEQIWIMVNNQNFMKWEFLQLCWHKQDSMIKLWQWAGDSEANEDLPLRKVTEGAGMEMPLWMRRTDVLVYR